MSTRQKVYTYAYHIQTTENKDNEKILKEAREKTPCLFRNKNKNYSGLLISNHADKKRVE